MSADHTVSAAPVASGREIREATVSPGVGRDWACLLSCSTAEYFDDAIGFDVPSLSQSIAKVLVQRTPMHARSSHPRLGGQKYTPTEEMEQGVLVHELLLGVHDRVVVVDAKDFKTNAAKEQRDSARTAGKTPIIKRKFEEAQEAVLVLRDRLKAYGFTFGGRSEVAIAWDDEGVLCRGMLDHLVLDSALILDLKTCASAHPRKLAGTMVDHGYDIQAVAYTRAVERLVPGLVGRVRFIDLFCELEPPYVVTPVEPSGEMLQLGNLRWERARETWRRCLETDTWPAYTESTVRLSPKPWSMAEELEAQS